MHYLGAARTGEPHIPAVPPPVQVAAPLVLSDEGRQSVEDFWHGGDYHSPGIWVSAPKWVALRYFPFGPRGSTVSGRQRY